VFHWRVPWYVYLVRCGDDSLYTGITTDPARRLAAHNVGRGAAYTRSRRPVALAHLEPAADRSAALRREWALKQLPRRGKEALVARSAVAGGSPTPFTGFRPAALTFFRNLARHNRREWFEAHREQYELEVREPLRALVEEMDVRLARIAPEIVGDPRRSIFRINRDVRFSKDKSPYKTHGATQFYHRDAGRGAGQEATGAGAALYFHLSPTEAFSAGGIWMPARPSLARLRDAIADDPDGFEALLRAPAFRRRFKRLEEEALLKRLPRGYAPGHPAERWLRYQSFTAFRPLGREELLSPRLPAILERDFAALVPLVRWMNEALGYQAAERR
jgi:uncharacterized protein (TIGR02453 family)